MSIKQLWSIINTASVRLAVVAFTVFILPRLAFCTAEQASSGVSGSGFAFSVGESGNLGLVGAAYAAGNSAQGAAYVFRNLDTSSGTVTQDVKLVPSDASSTDDFGYFVSESGTLGIVSADGATVSGSAARGAAYIFRNLDTATGTIVQNAKLIASDGTSPGTFGYSVAASGTIGLVSNYAATVGANASQGTTYLYRNLDTASGAVTQNAKLIASDGTANSYFGYAVSESGNAALVGAQGASVNGTAYYGAAYVFRNLDTANGVVSQNAKLFASDAGGYFGTAVSQSGTIGLVGADDASVSNHSGQGAAYVFRGLDTVTGNVSQSVKLISSDGAAEDAFGVMVSQSGSTALVGAPFASSGRGAAYFYRNLDTASGTVIQDVELTPSDGSAGSYFGSVSLDGDQFNIGAYYATVGGVSRVGRAYYGSISSMTTLDTGKASKVISDISFVSQDNWIIGQTTSSNQVTLSKGDTANVTASGKQIYVGEMAGSSNNTLIVQGTITTSAITISAPLGSSGNTLQVVNDANATAGIVNAAGGIAMYPGGTLQLLGGASVTDRIGNTTPLTLIGGTLNLGGLSEGAAGAVGLGLLNVTASSILDFGSTGTANVIEFSGIGPHTVGTMLRVVELEDNPGVPNGRDRLLFAGLASSFTTAFLQSDVSIDGVGGYATAQYSGYYEVFEVPEPTYLWPVAILFANWMSRRRRLFRSFN